MRSSRTIGIGQHKYGTARMAHYHLRRAPELDMLQAGVAMSGDNDQVDLMLPHELDDLLKWFAEFDAAAGGNGIFAR